MWRLTKSRTGWLAIVLLGAMAVFVLRLFQLQIIQHEQYVSLAKSSQQRQFVLPAERGMIYMMDGQAPVSVVLNRTTYTVIADPQVVKDDERAQIIADLRAVAGGEVVKDLESRLSNKKSRYEILAKNISKAQAERLKKKNFAGLLYQKGSIRSYPENGLGAHVLGFVNDAGDGQYGIEGALNDKLKGKNGVLRSVTDVRNVPLTVGKDNVKVEPVAGENIVLSVDRNIQGFVEEALKDGVDKAGATEGSAIVMNPKNGQVLAMANYPTYSPADYSKQDNVAVFMNNVTMSPFEPASVIKTFSFATAIDKGVISPSSTYYNTDCIQVEDRKMCNAIRGLTGTLTVQQAFSNSLNVGTITAIRKLGNGSQINLMARRTMYDYFHNKFGFGEKTGIELNEATGYIYEPDSQEGNEVRYSAMTYGQSLNLTMVQVAAGFSSVVNGGQYYRPTVIAGKIDTAGNLQKINNSAIRQTVSNSTSEQMKAMLRYGRSHHFTSKSDKPGYNIGGKTGTAEIIVNGKYTKSETAATYVGYGGADTPEYVIMVRVSAPGKGRSLEGGLHAGPIFTNISNQMIDYLKIAPKV